MIYGSVGAAIFCRKFQAFNVYSETRTHYLTLIVRYRLNSPEKNGVFKQILQFHNEAEIKSII